MMTRFLLIRHATNDTVGHTFAARTASVHLNDAGRQQAQHLAERLAHLPLAAIYSSPLERALETAAPLAQRLQLNIQIDSAFWELDGGTWTNATYDDLKNDNTFQQFNTFRSGTRIPGGELMLQAQSRIVCGLQALCAPHENGTVAVVSHADIIKAAVAYYAGIPLDLFHRIEISPASVSIVEIYPETARIMLVNHTGTLPL